MHICFVILIVHISFFFFFEGISSFILLMKTKSSHITNFLLVAIGPWSSQLPLYASCLLIDSNLRFSKFHFVTWIYDRKMPSCIYLQLYHSYCYGHVTYVIVKNTHRTCIVKKTRRTCRTSLGLSHNRLFG